MARIRRSARRWRPRGFSIALLLAAALAGCAAPAAVAPPPAAGQGGGPATLVRTPEFVALVAGPGETLASLAETWLHDPARSWEIAEFNGVTAAAPGQEIVIPLRPFRRGGLTPERYQTVPVLVYHHFAEKSTSRMVVKREAFEAQMRLLRERGYQVVSLERFLDFLEFRGQLPEKSVVITIDDGWRSAYDIAFPILRNFGYPASLFICPQLIAGGSKSLSWDQLREMAAQGITVESHTASHRNLVRRQPQESPAQYFDAVQSEIADSARAIEQELGRRPTVLAYSYGETNGLVIALLRQHGFRAAFTVVREANPFFTANFHINRSMIYGDFDLAEFEKNLDFADRKALQ